LCCCPTCREAGISGHSKPRLEMSHFEIPEGLTAMLQEFTVAVLRNNPPDLLKFAYDHFRSLYEIHIGTNLHSCSSMYG